MGAARQPAAPYLLVQAVLVQEQALKAAQEKMGVGAQVGLNVAFITVAITLIWGAGQLSFKFFESPFLKLKEQFHG